MEWISIGLGGFVGAIARKGLSSLVIAALGVRAFPLGTFSVNVLGCFAVGLLGALAEERLALSPELRGLLFVGFLGAFTTFSTFSVEMLDLLRGGQVGVGLLYAAASMLLGLGAVWLGMQAAGARLPL
jgi:CrcB protein